MAQDQIPTTWQRVVQRITNGRHHAIRINDRNISVRSTSIREILYEEGRQK
jgi:hypothetical protein